VVHVGISRPPTPPHPTADIDGAVVARLAEELGFESIFYGEHPIRPVGQEGQGVHADGVPFFQDTLVMLARASAMTSRIKLGGGVFLVPEHNPVQFAKELASLDFYSGGRLIVGAGVGWSRVECELLGGQWDRRWAQTRESIQIMKRLWSQDTAEYEGEFYSVPPVQLYPQPATRPWPPVLLAARGSARSFRRIVEYGDGWIPAFAGEDAVAQGPAHVEQGRRLLDRLAVEAGRDPASLQITAILRGPQVDGDLSPGQVVDRAVLRRFEAAGVDRAAISLPTLTCERDAREALERIAARAL
jgi:probable F420-dependent oxidoreductase